MPTNLPMLDWSAIESALIRLGRELKEKTRLTLIGSSVSMSKGQPDRMTMDIDVWRKTSDFDQGDLKSACERSGIAFNPQSFEVDGLYLQLVDQGIVDVGEFEGQEMLMRAGNLFVDAPPPENIIASKLGRCTERDLEDCLFLAKKSGVTIKEVEAAIDSMHNEELKQRSLENLTILELITQPPSMSPRHKGDEPCSMEP